MQARLCLLIKRSFMRYRLLTFILFFVVSGATPGTAQEQVDAAVFARIRNAELNGSHIPEIAHYLTDVSGPRLTNSPGYQRAAEWAVKSFKKWGLRNAALEPWGEFGKQWELREFSMSMKVPYAQPLMAFAEPWSANTAGVQQGAVVILTESQAADTTYLLDHLAGLKGKILLVTGDAVHSDEIFKPAASRFTEDELINIQDNHLETRVMVEQIILRNKVRRRIDVILKRSQAIARIAASRYNVNGIVHVQASNGYRLTDPQSIPKVSMSFEDGQRIKRLVQSGHEVQLSLNLQGWSSNADTKGYNVVAEIPGTDPALKSQLVMLGGHLDSWQAATGGTDNAAGCTVVMEAMRLLDSLGLKPKRTIRIGLWGGEEQGVYGSYYYVKNHFMNADGTPNADQRKVSGYFNFDYGTGKIRGIYAQGNTVIKPLFEAWFIPFHDLGAKTVTLKAASSTDHLSFDWAGIPGFQFIQDPVDEMRTHHTNLDDYDHLQIDDLKQAAIIVASFVYQASIRQEPLPRKPFVKETFVFDGL